MTAFMHATGIVTRVRKLTTQSGDPMTVAGLEVTQSNSTRLFLNLQAYNDMAAKLADIRDGSVLSVQGAYSEGFYEKDGVKKPTRNIKVAAILAGFVPQTQAPELEGVR